MKNIKVLLLMFGLFALTLFQVQADCVNTCGSINDGKCGLEEGNPACLREDDPTKANCNMYDSMVSCRN